MSSPDEQREASAVVGVTVDAAAPIASISSSQTTLSLALDGQESDTSDKLTPQSSRLLSATISSDLSAMTKSDAAIPVNSQSHPLGGSRLLALGSRNPQNTAISSMHSTSSQSPVSFAQKNGNVGVSAVVDAGVSQSVEPSLHLMPVAETQRPNNGFSPFGEHRDAPALANTSPSEAIHRGPLTLAGDRAVFPADHILAAEPNLGGGFFNSHMVQSLEPVGSGIAAAKGSRFAKFFDGKNRDSQPASFAKGPTGTSGLSQSAYQKTDLPGLYLPHNSETKAIEDIFAMLSNSAQVSIDPNHPKSILHTSHRRRDLALLRNCPVQT